MNTAVIAIRHRVWRRGNLGFTLVELIIVISVIAILVGIALPRLRGMIDEGNTAKAASELRALQAAVESYYIHNSKTYPTVAADWQTALTAAGTRPRLIGSALKDPFSGTGAQYRWAKSTSGLYYVIWSLGADGVADVTGVDNSGDLTGSPDDDIYVSNGTSGVGGFN